MSRGAIQRTASIAVAQQESLRIRITAMERGTAPNAASHNRPLTTY